jgi:hypothetical protein
MASSVLETVNTGRKRAHVSDVATTQCALHTRSWLSQLCTCWHVSDCNVRIHRWKFGTEFNTCMRDCSAPAAAAAAPIYPALPRKVGRAMTKARHSTERIRDILLSSSNAPAKAAASNFTPNRWPIQSTVHAPNVQSSSTFPVYAFIKQHGSSLCAKQYASPSYGP